MASLTVPYNAVGVGTHACEWHSLQSTLRQHSITHPRGLCPPRRWPRSEEKGFYLPRVAPSAGEIPPAGWEHAGINQL